MLAATSLAVALAAAVVARWAYVRLAAGTLVDQHYWLQAAAASRADRRLPARLPGKYLLEDEAQSYPPVFGLLLSFFPETWLERGAPWLTQIADALLILLIGWMAWRLGLGLTGIAVVVAVIGLTPALVAYNVQVNPRSLANLFLSAKLLLEVAAAGGFGDLAAPAWMLWTGAAVFTALVFLTHKMTTQLMLALWPAWAWALGSVDAALMPIAGLTLSILLTGRAFAFEQWRAHGDIVRFWHKHWRLLGAHAFRHSPIYGDPALAASAVFHKPGLQGIVSHLALIVGHAAIFLPLPLTLLFAPAPPAWLGVWFFGAAVVAVLTLFVPPLKCLGGGHLYLINLAAPGALWWAALVDQPALPTLLLFAAGMAATLAALAAGWLRRARLPIGADLDFERLVSLLQKSPPARVAIFPLVRAEALARLTPHAVLWGGHGYGFARLEPLLPVISRPVTETLRANAIDWVAWNADYWPEGEAALKAEGAISECQALGLWRLAAVSRG